jgi:hypothetical protein
MGFTTCGHDGNVYFYDLFVHTGEKNKRNGDMDYQASEKGTKYSQIVNLPNSPNYECIAVGNDKKLVQIKRGKTVTTGPKEGGAGQKTDKLDASLSAITMMKSGRAIIAGVGE